MIASNLLEVCICLLCNVGESFLTLHISAEYIVSGFNLSRILKLKLIVIFFKASLVQNYITLNAMYDDFYFFPKDK